MRAHLRLMRRVLAPLRRCLFDDGRRTRLRRSFADDDRRTRLRALYEDAALVRGSDAAVIGETDPTTVIADRKIADAARRGVFDNLDGRGKRLEAQPHRSAALSPERAGAEMAEVLAAQSVRAPRSTCGGASTRARRAAGAHPGGAPRRNSSGRGRAERVVDASGMRDRRRRAGTRASNARVDSRRSWPPPAARGEAGVRRTCRMTGTRRCYRQATSGVTVLELGPPPSRGDTAASPIRRAGAALLS